MPEEKIEKIYENISWILWIIVILITIIIFLSTDGGTQDCNTNSQTIYQIFTSLLCQYQLKGLIIFIILFTLIMFFLYLIIKSANKQKLK